MKRTETTQPTIAHNSVIMPDSIYHQNEQHIAGIQQAIALLWQGGHHISAYVLCDTTGAISKYLKTNNFSAQQYCAALADLYVSSDKAAITDIT